MNRMNRHVKIVCTLGPASRSPSVIELLLKAGMDIARLNMNYGTLEEHAGMITAVREASAKLDLPAGILLDLPGLKRRQGPIRPAFREHLEFARGQSIDFLALSFISTAHQVAEVKALMREMKIAVPVIVKIEKAPALEDSDAILDISDGIMVARGDLAIQISIEKVPLAQKRLIRAANLRGKPVITATQMLESMVESESPTRAEATDVANAVLDGTDALMLSEETSLGKHPPLVVETMVKIAMEAETAFPYAERLRMATESSLPEINDAAARAACQIAQQIGARAIVAFTAGGTTALRVAKYRPAQPIIAVTPNEKVLRRLAVVWGVHAVQRRRPAALDDVFELAANVAEELGVVLRGERIVLTAGVPLMISGGTNLVKVHVV